MRIAGLLPLIFIPLPASAAEPYARAALGDAAELVAGQQIYVTVDVFAPNFFTSPPQFPLFELPNALVTLPEERTQNLNETTDGTQYSGIRRRYAVVPQIPGNYQLPAITIELGYSVDGTTIHGTAETAPLSFVVGGDDNAPAAFAARNVTVEQTFDRPPATLQVGDAVVRTIIITAEDTQAIIIPPSNPGTAPGLSQYAKSAKTEDGISTGRRTVSKRTETLVYTAASEGTFSIPAIEYVWFDLDRHAMSVTRLPATDVTVASASTATGIAPEAEPQRVAVPFEQRRRVMLWIGLVLATIAVAWVLWRFASIAYRQSIVLRSRMVTSRRNRLRLLRKSILRDDPADVYGTLQTWSHVEGFRTLEDWAKSTHPDLRQDLRNLEGLLYSSRGGNFDRERVARLATSDRAIQPHRTRQALPELNPTD